VPRYNSGSAQPSLNRNYTYGIKVWLPPPSEQRAIADLLGSLDDRIELNRRIAATLEGMARAIFKSWFVDFDPVRAKAEGRPTGLPDDLAALFPDRFGQDGLPEGWASTLGAIGVLARSSVQPADLDPATPYIWLEHLGRRRLVLEQWGRGEAVDSLKIAFRAGDLLFGKLRPYFHKVAIAPVDGICSSDIFVIRPIGDIPRSFLYLTFSDDRVVQAASGASSGTRMPRADWDFMCRQSTPLPPLALLAAFDATASPVLAAMQVKTEQSRTLAALRDTLLPKLISGELRVNDAEKLVREVA
jgi:type I restriction enzyme S subunit